MTIIAVANLKGGTAKTTTTILLAEAISQYGFTVQVLDADPQGSATDWAATAVENKTQLSFDVTPANTQSIRRLKNTAEITLIDCPPLDPALIDAAINAADLIIIPVSPSGIEVSRMWEIVSVIESKNKAFGVLLTSVTLNTKSFEVLKGQLRQEKTPTYQTVICKREAIRGMWGTRPEKFHGYDFLAKEIFDLDDN